MPARILLLFAHPALQKSVANAALLGAAQGVSGVEVHDLYEAYPDLLIDVEREQRLLLEHDVVVFQHPFYWYSSPALLKEWQDLVLTFGWAYGPGGEALHGKRLLTAITTGGGTDAYRSSGHNHWTLRQLLAPFEQTATLCGMRYLPPFVVPGARRLAADDLARHAADYAVALTALRDGEPEPAADRDYWNRADDRDADWRQRRGGQA